MAQTINQFAQAPVQGEVDMTVQGVQIVSAEVKSDEAVPLIAGQAVKLVDSASPLPIVTAVTSNTDPVFGFVARTIKDVNFPANARVEIAIAGTILYMTANAAIGRGAYVQLDNAAFKVAPASGANTVVGWAYDKAAANNDLIRVYIQAPKFAGLDGGVLSANVTATLAEINAGKTLIAGVVGKKIRVTGIIERVTGNFASGTSVDVQSSATAVKVSVALEAALTTGAVLQPGDANVSRGAGFGVDLPTGEGVVVANIGSAQTGGTSIQYTINYALV